MANIIYSPDNILPDLDVANCRYVYLAGSKGKDWQNVICEALKNVDDITVLNSRRSKWNSTQNIVSEQVKWELEALESSEYFVFYFCKESKAPISLLNLGAVSKEPQNIFVCCEDDFWRKEYVISFCKTKGIELCKSIDEIITKIKSINN